MAGLAEISRSKFIDLAWGNQLKELLREEGLNTRSLYEISSATTQCTNVIGPCNSNSCMCWICGTPIFLTDQGNQWSAQQLDVYNKSGAKGNRTKVLQLARAKNPNIMHILPQCEHILPVMQAFLILGGLYWSETIAQEGPIFQAKMKKEYAWSHAYCNNLKDEYNFFDDAGDVREDMIRNMLVKIYTTVIPIQKYLIKRGVKKGSVLIWANEQIENMTSQYLGPLIEEYKPILANPLSFFSSVMTPIHHVEVALRKNLAANAPRLKVLDTLKPEDIPKLSIPEWRAKYALSLQKGKLPDEFIINMQDKLRMNFIKDLIIQLYDSAGNRKEKNIVNQFIMSLLNQREYLYSNILSRSIFRTNIDDWYNKFFQEQLMPIIDLHAIATLVNSPLVISGKEPYMITLVQTLALLNLLERIDPQINLSGGNDNYSNLRRAVSSDTTGLLRPFLNDIREYFATAVILLMNNETFAPNLSLTQYILGNLSTDRSRELGRYNPFASKWKQIFPKSTKIFDKLNVTQISDKEKETFKQMLARGDDFGISDRELDESKIPPHVPPQPDEPIQPTEETPDQEVLDATHILLEMQQGVGGGFKGGRKKTSKNKRHHKTRRYKKKHRRRQTIKRKRIKKLRTVKK